jgi:hypothetical protein
MPYRTVGEGITAFVEDLVTAAQKRRLAQKARRHRRTPTALGKVLGMLELQECARALLVNGNRILVARQWNDRDIRIIVMTEDNRKMERLVSEDKLERMNRAEMMEELGKLIQELDADLGFQR